MTRGKRNSQFEYRVTQTDRGVIIDFQGLSLFSRKQDLIQIVSLKCENKIAAKGSFPPETSSRTKFACSVNFGSLCEFEECNHDLGLPPSIIETEPSRILLKIYLRFKRKNEVHHFNSTHERKYFFQIHTRWMDRLPAVFLM